MTETQKILWFLTFLFVVAFVVLGAFLWALAQFNTQSKGYSTSQIERVVDVQLPTISPDKVLDK